MEYKTLNKRGTILDKEQLELYLEKLASDQIMQKNSNKNTYPIPQLLENYVTIKKVYQLLNEHIKLDISIHPAGEWILDNQRIPVYCQCKRIKVSKPQTVPNSILQ